MKKIIINICSILFIAVVFAQLPVINIENKNGRYIEHAYYKDVNNLLNQFEGTYLYTNGNDSLTIVFVKKTMQYNSAFYEDLIIGEYRYVENGIEKINSLQNLTTIYPNVRMHEISGNSIRKNESKPPCTDCAVNEKRLSASFSDDIRNISSQLTIRKITINGQEAIKIILRASVFPTRITGTPSEFGPTDTTVPSGEYILIKQP